VRIPNIVVKSSPESGRFGTGLWQTAAICCARSGRTTARTWSEIQQVGQPHYFKYGRKPSYGINAGLVRLPLETTDGRDVLLFCMPDTNGGGRERMTVWASFDRGETWPVKRLVYPGLSAYSSLAAGSDGTVYLLFERGEKKLYEHLAVVRFNLPWVLQGEPTGSGKVPTSSTDGGL
jgi:hypothetical protein